MAILAIALTSAQLWRTAASKQRQLVFTLESEGALVTYSGGFRVNSKADHLLDVHYFRRVEGLSFLEDNYYPVKVNDQTVSRICRDFSDDLVHLELLHAPAITDEACRSLSMLRNLRSLTLTGTEISANGVKNFANIKSLKSLDLSDNRLDDTVVKTLCTMQQLIYLDLYETEVSKDAMTYLRQSLPDTKVLENADEESHNPFGGNSGNPFGDPSDLESQP